MSEKTWKTYERRIAVALGGFRVPVTGIDRADRDVETPKFFVQAKRRRKLPTWLWEWLNGICATAKPHDKIGVMILAKPGQRDCDGLVVLRYDDFVRLHGSAKE
jgi:hypothetical protein